MADAVADLVPDAGEPDEDGPEEGAGAAAATKGLTSDDKDALVRSKLMTRYDSRSCCVIVADWLSLLMGSPWCQAVIQGEELLTLDANLHVVPE